MREFFPRLSIASVDDKQDLNEVVFSALIGFSLLGKFEAILLHQILPETGRQPNGNHSEDSDGFR
jgi:hypothetical protein